MKNLGSISHAKDIATKEYVDAAGKHVELTQAQYDQLSQAEKENGDVYFITDSSTPEYMIVNDSVPIGAIQAYGGSTAPNGWLICDGSAVSRTTYAELFEAIGTTYGSGDGSTTFNVPNLKGRTIVGVGESSATGHTAHTLGQMDGEETHKLQVSEMPKHSHTFNYDNSGSAGQGSYTASVYNGRTTTTSKKGNDTPHNNMQPYLVTNFIIKAKNYDQGSIPISGFEASDIEAESPSGTASNVQAELDALNGKTEDSGWILLSNTTGKWQYRKMGGIVFVQNTVAYTVSTGYNTLFTLPEGYRPNEETYFGFQGQFESKFFTLRVKTNGEVAIAPFSGNGAELWKGNIASFPAA